MKVIVTCGPGCAPVDEVRRITNFSTGELGVLLAEELAAHGHEVVCLRGEGATFRGALGAVISETFSTNDDLARRLEAESHAGNVGAVFHAAALCDFEVESVLDGAGHALAEAKISSREARLTVTLVAAPKLIRRLRGWFPTAVLVGWKYELTGTREAARARARAQIAECALDGCVLNGRAWGAGFAVCLPGNQLTECADKPALACWLRQWLATRR